MLFIPTQFAPPRERGPIRGEVRCDEGAKWMGISGRIKGNCRFLHSLRSVGMTNFSSDQ
jgi:hypothetical protein